MANNYMNVPCSVGVRIQLPQATTILQGSKTFASNAYLHSTTDLSSGDCS